MTGETATKRRNVSIPWQIALVLVVTAAVVPSARAGDWLAVATLLAPLPLLVGPARSAFRRWSERLVLLPGIVLGPWAVLEMRRFGTWAAAATLVAWLFGLLVAAFLSRRAGRSN